MRFLRNIFFFALVNILVVASVSIVIAILGAVFGIEVNPQSYMGLLILSALIGMGGSFISLQLSKWSAKRMFGLQIIDPARATGEQKQLVDTVHRLARAAQLQGMPEVGIYHSAEVNAFATGPSKNNSLVAVSTGLLSSMDWDQVEGVLGHEVAHVANGDMVALTLIQGVVNTFVVFLSHTLASIIANSGSEDNRRSSSGTSFMLYYVFQIAFGLLGSIVVAYFSRQREFRADRGSANFAGKGKMISALQALQNQTNRVMPAQQNEQFASFKIAGVKMGGLRALFSTHPPLAHRIAALQNNQ
ncbi:MAG: protease HtpX [Bdellovibrionaceae bacterium]|nr:protease HtpX [Pseudobdellovibrionaceae bacterium]